MKPGFAPAEVMIPGARAISGTDALRASVTIPTDIRSSIGSDPIPRTLTGKGQGRAQPGPTTIW